jgi:hypothetical protein
LLLSSGAGCQKRKERGPFLAKKLSEKSGKQYNDFHVQRPKAQRTALPATAEQSDEVPF